MSRGRTTVTPRHEETARRSRSPLTTYLAFPATAQARNLSSSASRQTASGRGGATTSLAAAATSSVPAQALRPETAETAGHRPGRIPQRFLERQERRSRRRAKRTGRFLEHRRRTPPTRRRSCRRRLSRRAHGLDCCRNIRPTHAGAACGLTCACDDRVEISHGRRTDPLEHNRVDIAEDDELGARIEPQLPPDRLWNDDLPLRGQSRRGHVLHAHAGILPVRECLIPRLPGGAPWGGRLAPRAGCAARSSPSRSRCSARPPGRRPADRRRSSR